MGGDGEPPRFLLCRGGFLHHLPLKSQSAFQFMDQILNFTGVSHLVAFYLGVVFFLLSPSPGKDLAPVKPSLSPSWGRWLLVDLLLLIPPAGRSQHKYWQRRSIPTPADAAPSRLSPQLYWGQNSALRLFRSFMAKAQSQRTCDSVEKNPIPFGGGKSVKPALGGRTWTWGGGKSLIL